MELKGKILVAISFFVILLTGVSIYYVVTGSYSDRTPVAEVNGSPIAVKDFKSELDRQRASIIDSFRRMYGAKYGGHFWETEYNGETPETAAKKRALNEIVRFKVELELAKQHGLVQGTSYDDLQREMDKENGQREGSLKAHQPIYGPVRLDESAFRNVYISKLRNNPKEMLSESELKASDEDLKRHYEQVKETLFVSEDRVQFQKISISYRDAQHSNDDQQNQAAKKRMNSIRQLAVQGKMMSEAVKALQIENDGNKVRYTEEELNTSTAGSYYKSQPMLFYVIAGGLKADEISSVFDEAILGEYVFIKITEREAVGYKNFDGNESVVRKSYLDSAYTDYVDKLAAEARVEIIPKIYDRIKMQ